MVPKKKSTVDGSENPGKIIQCGNVIKNVQMRCAILKNVQCYKSCTMLLKNVQTQFCQTRNLTKKC